MHRPRGRLGASARAARLLILLLAAAACGTIAPSPVSSAPDNTCAQDTDCAPFQLPNGPTPVCTAGACVVGGAAGNWTFVVALPSDAADDFVGQTYAVPYATLALHLAPPATATGAEATCQPLGCAQLPAPIGVTGELDCDNQAAVFANWNLGGGSVALPVQATFRPVVDQASVAVDATTAGLPLPAIEADVTVIDNPPAGALLGPGGGPPVEFVVSSQRGLPPLTAPLTYERTLQPLPPFDRAFPPDVSFYTAGDPTQSNNALFDGFDYTVGTDPAGNSTFPTFTFRRADGGALDGWTAYLRDASTLRRFSQAASLSGTSDAGVKLLTSHHPPPVMGVADALTNAQLVMLPPGGSPLPTWVFTPISGSLAGDGTYPKLPPAVTTSIPVLGSNGKPTTADLIFEAIDVCRYEMGGGPPVHDQLSANHDFDFVARSAHGSGPVTLPLGAYRVTAVPVAGDDDALTVAADYALADKDCNPTPAPVVQLQPRSVVSGAAKLADGTPLGGALVDFLPTGCSNGDSDADCLPRPGSTPTTTAGTFSMGLDPGTYLMRVRPADGSAWPWRVQPLAVTPTLTTTAGSVVVPAPVYAGLRLFDWNGNALADTLVRVFENPASGAPYEIGEELTDTNGHFDMYLDPTAQ